MTRIPRFEVVAVRNAAFVTDRRPQAIEATFDIRVIASCGSDFALAQRLVDAWNGVVDQFEGRV
jgi:hypothetical protein